MSEDLAIQHDAIQGRFSASVDGHGLELDYQRQGDRLIFTHTGTAPALRGRGLAGRLVEHALQWAAPLGLQVVPACSYVAAHIKRYPRWQRLTLAPAAQQVMNYWFGPLGSAEDGQIRPLWFQKSEATDAEIKQRFGALIEEALAGRLPAWSESALARLARILLLDQFTRNVYRGEARSFAGDGLALQDTLALLDSELLPTLEPLQRWFALMPLEHAESLAMQDRSVAEFTRLAQQDARLAAALDYAKKHREVIVLFGRYPHRNALLGRASSAEELAYLAQPGAGF
ncbi:DUF924 family protein [Roseateles oligotrophus]|uniref:DUF924 family protein n=1 Tax=Roseateles oligotrophus TaxID=1769250 RepID=A0ABT2YGS8_9BURK|nr:DUF924 family protein [Roseateles oligotrophus]MCV2369249.1 DUF924 family protein [Roseateles oligotrophus]